MFTVCCLNFVIYDYNLWLELWTIYIWIHCNILLLNLKACSMAPPNAFQLLTQSLIKQSFQMLIQWLHQALTAAVAHSVTYFSIISYSNCSFNDSSNIPIAHWVTRPIFQMLFQWLFQYFNCPSNDSSHLPIANPVTLSIGHDHPVMLSIHLFLIQWLFQYSNCSSCDSYGYSINQYAQNILLI